MNFLVNVRDPELGSGFRQWAERRILLAFTRYDREVLQAELTVSDDNGPRGGFDKRCSLALTTRRFGTLSFVTVAVNANGAVTAAVRRARRLLHRRLALQRRRRVVVTG